jgi:FkbM family methyltransferase
LLSECVSAPNSQKPIFEVVDFGYLCRYRARTLFDKEPETIAWLDTFDANDIFFDIGANIGIYSLYAAAKGAKQTVAFEPNALNYSLLNLNILSNNFQSRVIAFPVAFHDRKIFSSLNISDFTWGGALSSFDRLKDQRFDDYKPIFRQGTFGLTLDEFVEMTSFFPSHIKIDVDGNERCILEGGVKTLANTKVKSILVELLPTHPEYERSISLIQSFGFKRRFTDQSKLTSLTDDSVPYNHIFYREAVVS